jgi:AcrR family transcriptional regulator
MPRAGLNREQVVRAAAEFADERGYDHLTLSALADRIGVRPPSLYKHVDSLDDLRYGLSLLAYGELESRLRTALENKDRPLMAFAAAYRRFAHERPGLAATAVRVLPGYEEQLRSSEAAALQPLLTLLHDHGIADDRIVHVARFVRSTLHGFVSIEAADGFQRPESIEESFATVVEGLELVLSHQGKVRS